MQNRIILATAILFSCSGYLHAQSQHKAPQQYATIQAAIHATSPGDSVIVSKGTYSPFVVSGRTDLKIKAKGNVVIDAAGHSFGIYVSSSQDILISGFRVRNASEYGIRILSARVEVRKCRIRDCVLHGIFAELAQESLFVKNRITDVGGQGILIESDNVTASENRIVRPVLTGIYVQGDQCTVADNEIIEPTAGAIGVGSFVTAVYDNLIVGNTIRDAVYGISHSQGGSCSILENRTFKMTGAGIRIRRFVDGDIVRDNRINGSTLHGMEINCESGDFRDNRITKPGTGFFLDYDCFECDFRRNTVDRPAVAGFSIVGMSLTLRQNRVLESGGKGIIVYSEGNEFIRNRVVESAGHGFRVKAKNNLFRENVAKKNDGYDLKDTTEPGDNTYIDNDFGTIFP